MAFERPSPVTESTQELRLATTMTGGVSLAIWMAGVTREINLLSQASQWRRVGKTFPTRSNLTKESAACLKLYAELIDLLDVVVDVDAVSYTHLQWMKTWMTGPQFYYDCVGGDEPLPGPPPPGGCDGAIPP